MAEAWGAAKAEAYREIALTISQGWRINLDDLWKPVENEYWVDWLNAEADRIESNTP